MFAKNLLAGKRVLVTGGGTGLGRTIGRRACEFGAQLVICGRRAEPLEETARAFRDDFGAKVQVLLCDVREADQVEAMIEAAWAEGPVDVVVNNAAGAILGRTETLSARAFDAVIRTTLNGAIHTSLAAGKRWIAAERPGVLLYVIASGVESGRPFTTALTTAKGGVLTLMRSLAVEWGRHGIRTVGVGPGIFPTEGSAARLKAGGRAMDPAKGVPLGRAGEPNELADLCVFLMSAGAGYLTGEMITVDGGRALKGQDMEELFAWSPEQWDAIRAPRPAATAG